MTFPEQCDKKRNLRLAKTEKGTLYAALQAENCHAGNVDRKHLCHNSNQLRIRGEKTGEKSRAEHCKHNVDESGGKRDSDHAPDRLADAVKLTGTSSTRSSSSTAACENAGRRPLAGRSSATVRLRDSDSEMGNNPSCRSY